MCASRSFHSQSSILIRILINVQNWAPAQLGTRHILSSTHKHGDSAEAGAMPPEGIPLNNTACLQANKALVLKNRCLLLHWWNVPILYFSHCPLDIVTVFPSLSVPDIKKGQEGIRRNMRFQDCSSCLLKEHLKKVIATSRILFIQL